MLEIKQPAPEFNAPNQDDTPIKLSDFIGKQNVVLYFYPKDDTPGCTIEANQFTALADAFSKLDTAIIGVSKDNCDSHRAFIDKYSLNLQLLADTDGKICEQYGVWQLKDKGGVKKPGIVRSTFIIDKDGKLADIEYGVNAEGHAQAVLDKIKNMH